MLQQQVNFLIGFIEGEKEEEKCDNADKLDLKPEPVTQPEPDAEAGEPVLDKDKDKETLEKEARRYDRCVPLVWAEAPLSCSFSGICFAISNTMSSSRCCIWCRYSCNRSLTESCCANTSSPLVFHWYRFE